MEKDLRKKLGIDDWLELVKEDRNCNGAYISFGQYMYLLEKDNQELKKQLEEIDSKLFFTKNELEMRQKSIDNKLRQQKEFIEWLEDKLNMCDGFLDTIKSDLEEISYAGRTSGKTYIATQIMKNETAMKCYEEVLSKYKEIIGVKDE